MTGKKNPHDSMHWAPELSWYDDMAPEWVHLDYCISSPVHARRILTDWRVFKEPEGWKELMLMSKDQQALIQTK